MPLQRAYVSFSDVTIVPICAIIWYQMSSIGFPYIFTLTVIACVTYTWKHWHAFTLARIVQSFLFLVTRIFFREVNNRGSHKIPQDGPVIFVCAPHSNQFLDPLIVMQAVDRDIGFLAAAKSMRKKYIGIMARALGSISVERAQDLAKPGKGKVTTSEHGKYVHGHDTTFTKTLQSGHTIVVKGEALSIAKVQNDTEIETTGGTQLEHDATEPTKFSYAPKVDQHAVFENVWKHLGEKRQCVGIFPEGGSHDRSDLLPLKAGVTIMALGTEAKYPGCKVKIVPVGLNYFSGHRFRSRAYVDVGDPISIPQELLDAYKEGGQAKRDACTKLLEIIQQRLKTVTVTANNHEVLQLIWAVRRLYKPEGMRLTTEQKLELTRRFEKVYHKMEDDDRIKSLKKQVEQYNRHLSAFGLRDHQVARTKLSTATALPLIAWRLFLLMTYSVFALPGLVLNMPVVIIARVISAKKAKEAKAASTVKLTGRDVMATWKVLVSMSLIPIVFIIYPLLAAYIGKWSGYGALKVWAYFALFQPFIMYGSVRFIEVGREIARSLVPLSYALLHINGTDKLFQERKRLQKLIRSLATELGPEVFGSDAEFAKQRLIKQRDFESTADKTETGMKRNWSRLDFGNPSLSDVDELSDGDKSPPVSRHSSASSAEEPNSALSSSSSSPTMNGMSWKPSAASGNGKATPGSPGGEHLQAHAAKSNGHAEHENNHGTTDHSKHNDEVKVFNEHSQRTGTAQS